jgi:hypothetical protein
MYGAWHEKIWPERKKVPSIVVSLRIEQGEVVYSLSLLILTALTALLSM